MKGFYRQKLGKLKEWIILGKGTFSEGKAGDLIRPLTSPVLTRGFHTD